MMAAATLGLTTLAAPTATALCGDGVFDAGESCDDGNLSGADCCSATCALQSCNTAPQPAVTWQAIGPFDIGGRVTSVVVDPSNSDSILIGTPAAGIWRSQDRGATWVSIAAWLDVAPVSALAIDPSAPARYVAGTGALLDAGTVTNGIGSVRTSNEGVSWSIQDDPLRNAYVGAVLIWPGEPARVLFASDRGLVLSIDGGATLSAQMENDSFTSLALDPFDTNGGFASGRLGFYRSLDRGATWALVSAWPGINAVANPGVATAVLAVSQQTPGLLRAAVQDLATFSETDRIILLESLDFGASWTQLPTPASLCPEKDRCGFANALAVDPADDARMLLGGDRLFRSADGGQSWTPLASTIRGVHAIAIDATGAVVVGRSGVAVLDAAWQTVTLRNAGLPITQVASLDAKRDGSGALLAGTSDHGTILGQGDPFGWQVIFAENEPASEARFDPFDPNVLYAGRRRGDFSRSDDGGVNWTPITTGLDATQSVKNVAPLAPNPLVVGELFTGRSQLFRSVDRGDSWSEHRPIGAPEVGLIAPSPAVSDRLYFSLQSGGTLYRTDGINTTNFVLDPRLDARITSVYPDPSAQNRVYVAMTHAANLVGSLWRTENFGVTWADQSFGKLPGVSDVVRDAFGGLYASTLKGVYRSASEGQVWSFFNNGLPVTSTSKLVVSGDSLVTSTVGRGLFKVPVRPLVAIDTIPPGQRLMVDGVLYDGPFFGDWAAGTQHSIAPYLLQTENTRQEFVSWLNDGSQQQLYTATGLNEWPTVAIKVLHRLTTQASPAAGGSIIPAPASQDGFYPLKSIVQLVALPAPGYRFKSWLGVGTAGLLASVEMSQPLSVTALFQPLQIEFRTQPPGLTIGIDGQNVATPQTFQWASGSQHPLDAPAVIDLDPGDPFELVFDHWSDYLPRVHEFEMRSETFTADVTANYLQTVREVTTPTAGVQRLSTPGTQSPRRELRLTIAPDAGERLPESLQFLRSSAGSGVINELALPRGSAVTRVNTWVEGRTLEGMGGLTGDGRTRRTRIILFNPGAQNASVGLTLLQPTGVPTASGSDLASVAPGELRSVMLDEALALPRSYDGFLVLQSTQPLHVCILGVTENLRTFNSTDPILFHLFDESDVGVPTIGARQVLLATAATEHVLALFNPAPATTSGALLVQDRTGAALEAEVNGAAASSIPFALAAGEHRVLRLRFPAGVPGTETVPNASVKVVTDTGPPPRVRQLEERQVGAANYGSSTLPLILPRSLPPSLATTDLRLPVDLTRRDTGLVLTNGSASAMQVTLLLEDGHGGAAGVWTLDVPAGEQRLQLVSELVPAPPVGFFGQLRANAPSAIDAMAFTRTLNARGEEILAGVPLVTVPTDPPDAVHGFPFGVDGDTFASEWWLFSSEAAPRRATFHFADAAGDESVLPMQAPSTP